jgi:hypothetical protein
MNVKRFNLNGKDVLVFDAPANATHGKYKTGANTSYEICRKNKVLDTHAISENGFDYIGKLINVGQLSIADESIVADLFNPVKNGNFFDYEHNGVFYPSANAAFRDIVSQETNFMNPFVLIINP